MDGDWDEPNFNGGAPFGNNSIEEHNVISISELIKKYPNVFASTDQNAKIEEDIQIKGRITGNDLGGNIYKQVTLQDNTGAIIIAINEGGLNGYLAEGTEILVDLKDLYIGGYRKQPELGAPYNGNSIGRMSKDIWAQHFKIVGACDTTVIKAVDFNDIKDDMNNNCAKLVTLKGVTFKNADGKNTFTTALPKATRSTSSSTSMEQRCGAHQHLRRLCRHGAALRQHQQETRHLQHHRYCHTLQRHMANSYPQDQRHTGHQIVYDILYHRIH